MLKRVNGQVIQSMLAGKSINDLKFSKKLHFREKNFHIFFSSKSRSSFLDSSASLNPVINGKPIVNTKPHIELSQLLIVSQNFISFKLLKFIHSKLKGAN